MLFPVDVLLLQRFSNEYLLFGNQQRMNRKETNAILCIALYIRTFNLFYFIIILLFTFFSSPTL